jgi:hypothetical protein
MAVFRVEKNKGYTVMSNHHLRDKGLSLKAKGLLSQMLSLPDNWDYTLKGLAAINREGIDAIREAVKELERAGYIVRSRERDANGCLRGIEYVIYEQPNTIPAPNGSAPDCSVTEQVGAESHPEFTMERYRQVVLQNIDYDVLAHDQRIDCSRLDEIVNIIVETVSTSRKTLRIAGDDYPSEMVRERFLKLNQNHIRYVMDCMAENTTKIRNIKQYLRAVLFYATTTMENYYTSLVSHDMSEE